MELSELAVYVVVVLAVIAFLKASSTAKLAIAFIACLAIGAVVLAGPTLTMGVQAVQTSIHAFGG